MRAAPLALLLLALLGWASMLAPVEAKREQSKIVLEEEGFVPTKPAGSAAPVAPNVPPSVAAKLALAPHSLHVRSSLLGRGAVWAALNGPDRALAQRAQQSLNCSVCESLVELVRPLIFEEATQEWLVQAAEWLCTEHIRPMCKGEAQCQELCTGIISVHRDQFFTLLDTVATPRAVCAALQQCPADPPPTPSTLIPEPSFLDDLEGEKVWPAWNLTTGTGTFAHLSDGHIDQLYTVGTNTDCGLPLCCRASDGPGPTPATTAGYWGAYSCDTPPQLAHSLMKHLASLNPPLDFVLYTGDDPAHDVWRQEREGNVRALWDWSELMRDALAPLGVPVFHTLGNHEIHPVNQFAGPEADRWLYEQAVEAWAPFLPRDARRTMRYGGYYQARVRPGLRVISINSNYFTDDNFWLLANRTAGETQLNWFADVLRQAEARSEKAIVICHAPLSKWNAEFARSLLAIAERFQSVIVNYFFGHTHANQYVALRDSAGRGMHVAYTGGSVAPFTDMNPGYLRYEFDRAAVDAGRLNQLVTEVKGHWIDLEQANRFNNTDMQWSLTAYVMSAQLDTPLTPEALVALAPQYATNSSLYEAYTRALYKGVRRAAPSPQFVACSTLARTSDELHQCMHAAGVAEKEVLRMEKMENVCDIEE